MNPDSSPSPRVGLPAALLPLAVLLVALFVQLKVLKGDPQLPLVLATVVAAATASRLGRSWKSLEEGMVQGISIALPAILILLTVGILIATWIQAGIVPFMIDLGLRILSPSWFPAASCLIASVVGVATGSSWTTAGTVGIALIGIGQGLNIPSHWVAGAVVSGAYFGDKMSPLSDTTNLAPAVAGSELFEHIRHMAVTTLPAWAIAMGLYVLLGLAHAESGHDLSDINQIRETLAQNFKWSPALVLAPACVLFLVFRRVPALPALMSGVVLGAFTALWVQGTPPGELVQAMHYGVAMETGVERVDELLNRGGLDGMMYTISLILCALAFGGVMERAGFLDCLTRALLRGVRTTGQLIAATLASCIGVNAIAPDQYLAIILPGRMFRQAYVDRDLEPKNLSRCLEDAGTLTSPLIPWNSCGAFMQGALTVGALQYAPFAFVNWITPIVSLILGWTGWGITRLVRKEPVDS